jgi:hypothetical protein
MAVADVFRAEVNFELPDSPATCHLHYQELNPTDSGKVATEALADGLYDGWVGNELPAMMGIEARVTGIRVYKLGTPVIPPTFQTLDTPGIRAGETMTAISGVRFGIVQAFFPSKNNGHVTIPGIAEPDCEGNTWENLFMIGVVQALAIALGEPIIESPQVGLWRLGVLSREFLKLNPGDYAGAFADATAATATPIVGSVRLRRTKRRGAPGS